MLTTNTPSTRITLSPDQVVPDDEVHFQNGRKVEKSEYRPENGVRWREVKAIIALQCMAAD